jgi:hypothetical protein
LLALIQPTDLTRLERFFTALCLVPSTMGIFGIAFLAPGECSACNGGWWLCGAVRETVVDRARVCLVGSEKSVGNDGGGWLIATFV